MVAGERGVISELEVNQQSSEHREAAGPAIDQAGILADPAQAGEPGEVAFQERGRVADRASMNFGPLGLEPGQERFELPPDNRVIVAPLGVAGDLALASGWP